LRTDRFLPYGAALLSSVIFGFSFLFTKLTLPSFGGDIFHMLSYRFLLATGVMGLFRLFGLIRPHYRGKPVGQLVFIGLVEPVLYFICETLGLRLLPSSQAGLMIALIPVAVTVLAAVFLKEKPTWIQTLFIIVSVGGVMTINLAGGAHGGTDPVGVALLMGAVLSAAVFNILSRKASLAFKPVEVTWLMMCVGAAVFTLIAWARILFRGLSWQTYFAPLGDLKGMLTLSYLSVLSSVAAYFLMNYVLSRMEAARSAITANITTLVSVIAGVVVLGEPFGWPHCLGSAMIIAGVWGVNRFRRPVTPEKPLQETAGPAGQKEGSCL
jgi:drug/metabolite transporter (DMT)-like permease